MKLTILSAAFVSVMVGGAVSALAQQQDALENRVASLWQADATIREHIAEVIGKLIEDRRRLQADLAAAKSKIDELGKRLGDAGK